MQKETIRIGGASGYWGDSYRATPQLLADGGLDFIVYDYLAEITMSIMARARVRDDAKGYALDFVTYAMADNVDEIARQGVRIISNAGGVNPRACARALQKLIDERGLDLKVACVIGDDLMDSAEEFSRTGVVEMFSGDEFPAVDKVRSINAYLGAFPIAQALDSGADIIITGRCVDSAVTLGACIHSFGWQADAYNLLATGSLAGHILECGTQATGGNFTDWEPIAEEIDTLGYPIAEIGADGGLVITKPAGSGGIVTTATVAEQMLYEIGDPQDYLLPDVRSDFSRASLQQEGENRVRLEGATGRPASDSYKVSATFEDQYRGGTQMTYCGFDADRKARAQGEAIFRSARRTLRGAGMPDFAETSIEIIGAESQYGNFRQIDGSREVVLKVAAKHPDPRGIDVLFKECVGLGLATPPALSGFQSTRPRPSPVVRLFSFLVPKDSVSVTIEIGDRTIDCPQAAAAGDAADSIERPPAPAPPRLDDAVEVPLVELAWGRSGDKGNRANIGIIARRPEFLPYIYAALTEAVVAERFEHFLESKDDSVERYLLPGSHALNFVLHEVLGGGGIASIRNDPQGKSYAQVLLQAPIPVSREIAERLTGGDA